MHNQPQAQEQSPQQGPDCPPEDQAHRVGGGTTCGAVANEARAHAEHCPSCSMFLIGLVIQHPAQRMLLVLPQDCWPGIQVSSLQSSGSYVHSVMVRWERSSWLAIPSWIDSWR